MTPNISSVLLSDLNFEKIPRLQNLWFEMKHDWSDFRRCELTVHIKNHVSGQMKTERLYKSTRTILGVKLQIVSHALSEHMSDGFSSGRAHRLEKSGCASFIAYRWRSSAITVRVPRSQAIHQTHRPGPATPISSSIFPMKGVLQQIIAIRVVV